jgi:hypothetical protein
MIQGAAFFFRSNHAFYTQKNPFQKSSAADELERQNSSVMDELNSFFALKSDLLS